MKKSKFLLLGSVASLASIPFVAAKCGETKEEERNLNSEKPGGDKSWRKTTPGGNTNKAKIQVKIQSQGKNPGENTEPGKNPGGNTEPWKNPAEEKHLGK